MGHGETVQRAERIAAGDGGIGRLRSAARLVGQERDDGVDGRVDPIDAGEVGFHHLDRGELAGRDGAGEIGRRAGAEIGRGMHRAKLHRLPPAS